jgi:hypothetical protein
METVPKVYNQIENRLSYPREIKNKLRNTAGKRGFGDVFWDFIFLGITLCLTTKVLARQ